MGCVSSEQTVSVTPAIDHVFRDNDNDNDKDKECSGSGRVVVEDPPRATLKKLVCRRSSKSGRRSQRSGGELGSESGRGSESLSVRVGNILEAEQVAVGWPAWLSNVAGEAIHGWVPLRSDAFQKLEKIGEGTYSRVFRAVETETGRIVALKKVRFDHSEPESVKFMAREILILRRLNHPNIIKLQGLITSKRSCNIQLVFEYMEHDLVGLFSAPDIKFTTPQIKCYMKQLLSGLDHCHSRGVMHRDIKGSNLLLSNEGILKVADFGLGNFSNSSEPLTSQAVTLWYRPPELLLGATDYGAYVDLWSVGCVFAQLLLGKPILRGKTEVELLHNIFKLCGSPPEDYWKKSKLPHAMPQQNYDSCLRETLKDLSETEINLIETLLSIEPHKRGTASSALVSQYFTTKPFACDPSSLPIYPPSKEIDKKHREKTTRKKISGNGRRGIEARKALSSTEADDQTETFQKRIGHLVHNSSESDASFRGKRQNPLDHKKDEASLVKNASQGDVPFSGPLQVSISNNVIWEFYSQLPSTKDDYHSLSVLIRGHNYVLSPCVFNEAYGLPDTTEPELDLLKMDIVAHMLTGNTTATWASLTLLNKKPINFVFEQILKCATLSNKKWKLLFPSLIFRILNNQHPVPLVSGEDLLLSEVFHVQVKNVQVKDECKSAGPTQQKKKITIDCDNDTSSDEEKLILVLRIPRSEASSPVARALRAGVSTFQTILDGITDNQN